MRNLLWWAVTVPLLPLLLPQAWYTRRTALRLPVASGEPQGLAGDSLPGQPLRLLLVGESTVVGVGVACLENALAGQLAQALAARLEHPVAWRVCGENGIGVHLAVQRLLPRALSEPADWAVLVFGVNDTTGLSSRRRWAAGLGRMIVALQGGGAQVALSAVPPLQHFQALPWLLRTVLGWRAALMDGWARRLAARLSAHHFPGGLSFSAEYLAEDGYHPSALGYRVWAEMLADQFIAECRCPPSA
ncbi:SGNH/GDSL hydrolase family protein [Pseudomonas sp. B392_1p]|uniref:SGNH/GDSL hydrolase family protein n=1 Tax=Pseudomonas sp. B392_1p TaxID=3457507 RepID=UPI003FD43B04